MTQNKDLQDPGGGIWRLRKSFWGRNRIRCLVNRENARCRQGKESVKSRKGFEGWFVRCGSRIKGGAAFLTGSLSVGDLKLDTRIGISAESLQREVQQHRVYRSTGAEPRKEVLTRYD